VVEDMVMLGRGIAEADHFLSGESQLHWCGDYFACMYRLAPPIGVAGTAAAQLGAKRSSSR
jgi:hypothetical protein